MFLVKVFYSKNRTKKHECVVFCILFIVLCMCVLVCGYINKNVWGDMYAMPESDDVAVIIVYVFASLQLVASVFLLISIKQGKPPEVLGCVLVLLASWQVHLIIAYIAIILHTLTDINFRTASAFLRSLPLLAIQGLWLYYIATAWLYWRELTNYLDVPQFIQALMLKRKRRKAIQKDQRERLGHLPSKFMGAFVPQTRGLALANAL